VKTFIEVMGAVPRTTDRQLPVWRQLHFPAHWLM